MICITDLYDCVNPYIVIILNVCMLSYVFDMFHILLSGDSLRDLWNVCVCVCVYSLSMIKNLILTSTDSNEMCGP